MPGEPVPMPRHLLEPVLNELPIGRSVYTVPWALDVDPDGRCWINPEASGTTHPLGTATMRVTRVPDGFAVELAASDQHRWTHRHPVRDSYLPVVDLQIAERR